MSSSPNCINKELLVMINEHLRDPKYKTEICNKWKLHGLCVYSNKCRFAHGPEELMNKVVYDMRLKQLSQIEVKCNSFFEKGICLHGKNCTSSHDKRLSYKHSDLEYTLMLLLNNPDNTFPKGNNNRLSVFENFVSKNLELKKFSTLDSDKHNSLNSTREEIETALVKVDFN